METGGATTQRVHDSDLDDDENKPKEPVEEKKEEKKKANRKPLLKLDHKFLIENPRGLKHLYKHTVIDAEKNFQFKGKGNEISDFNKFMKVMRGWHFEAMPKIEVSYFADRMHRVGNHKDVKQFLVKLRSVYKGLEVMDDFQQIASSDLGFQQEQVQKNKTQ